VKRKAPKKTKKSNKTKIKLELPKLKLWAAALLIINIPVMLALNFPVQSSAMMTDIFSNLSIDCHVDRNDKPVYAGEFESIQYPGPLQPGELFNVKVLIKNTGNMPWFSAKSGCPGQLPIVYLGTTHDQDRSSQFMAPGIFGDTGWYSNNRIFLNTPRVNPGQNAEFSFIGYAPSAPGIYREYFAPVVEGITWIKDKAEFYTDITIGSPNPDQEVLGFTSQLGQSINLLDPKFFGDKKIHVDLSQQKMQLIVNNQPIITYPVSTGKPSTPTPVGTTKISLKQDVRVTGEVPHYIMPQFMMFRKGGYGIHALPSLANDRGVFWNEALNHIGEARSHGCIRLLPDDALVAYAFADVGTTVEVVR